ncbi:hypothetical protein DPMN_049443 [Dreissena polymorpha]|uniref:Uncharacterized protein n=1 Tax=Dreissena polymorpha TaxID=45954 RepID=A0A9D4CED0_DREPO|nr:hypothetical protein DPMN_049443 [Dreissena polymorpha]
MSQVYVIQMTSEADYETILKECKEKKVNLMDKRDKLQIEFQECQDWNAMKQWCSGKGLKTI